MSWFRYLWVCQVAMIKANLYGIMHPFKCQVCTQYKETRVQGEWDVQFIGCVEKEVVFEPNFPVVRYVWKATRTYYGELNVGGSDGKECSSSAGLRPDNKQPRDTPQDS